jgi:hypothetical protein
VCGRSGRVGGICLDFFFLLLFFFLFLFFFIYIFF